MGAKMQGVQGEGIALHGGIAIPVGVAAAAAVEVGVGVRKGVGAIAAEMHPRAEVSLQTQSLGL